MLAEIAKLVEKLKIKSEQNDSLKKLVEKSKAAIADAKKKYKEATGEVLNLKSGMADRDKEIMTLKVCINDNNSEIVNNKNQMGDLGAKIENLQLRLSNSDQEIMVLHINDNKNLSEIESLIKDNRNLQNSLDSQRVQNQNFAEKLASMADEEKFLNQEKDSTISDLRASLENLTKGLEIQRMEMENCENDKRGMNTLIEERESKIGELGNALESLTSKLEALSSRLEGHEKVSMAKFDLENRILDYQAEAAKKDGQICEGKNLVDQERMEKNSLVANYEKMLAEQKEMLDRSDKIILEKDKLLNADLAELEEREANADQLLTRIEAQEGEIAELRRIIMEQRESMKEKEDLLASNLAEFENIEKEVMMKDVDRKRIFSEIENSNLTLKSDIDYLKSDNSFLHGEISELREKIALQESEISELQEKIAIHESEMDAAIGSHNQMISDLQKSFNEEKMKLMKKNSDITKKKDHFLLAIDKLLSESNKKIENLSEQSQEYNKNLISSQVLKNFVLPLPTRSDDGDRNESLLSGAESVRSNLPSEEDLETKLKKTNIELDNLTDLLVNILKEVSDENLRTRQSLSEKDAEVDRLNEMLFNLQETDKQISQKEISDLTSKVQIMEKEISTMVEVEISQEKLLKDFQSKISALKSELSGEKNNVGELRSMSEMMEQNLDTEKYLRAEIEEALGKKAAECEKLQSTLNEQKRFSKDLDLNQLDQEKVIHDLSVRVGDLETELQNSAEYNGRLQDHIQH
jgi:chromosome segregation ATPase